MKKLISFKQLKSNCAWEIIQNRGTMYDCGYLSSDRVKCAARNCPVWKRLEEVKQESNRYEITRNKLCDKCAHNTAYDQICEHTGWDKRGLKKCQYRQLIKNI